MARKQKQNKPRIMRWKGLLAGAPRRVRIGALVLLAIAVVALVFVQLGLVGLGAPGSYRTYGNVLLTVVALGGLLLGIPFGTLLGLFAGAMMYVHALVQPLDYYEIMAVTPLMSVALFIFIGFLVSFSFAVALRKNPPLVRRIIYIVIICLIVSFVYTLAFLVNTFLTFILQIAVSSQGTLASLGSNEVHNLLMAAASLVVSVDVQFAFNAGVMIAASIVSDILVRKAARNEGQHGLLTIMRGWLAGIVVAVFAITAGISFVAITEQAKQIADEDMSDEIEYLCNQLSIHEARIQTLEQLIGGSNLPAGNEGDAEEQASNVDLLRQVFSLDGLLDGYKKEADGTIVVFKNGIVLLSNDDEYAQGATIESLLGERGQDRLDQIASSDTMQLTVYTASSGSSGDETLTSALEENLVPSVSLEMAFMRVGQTDGYTVMIIYTASKVFASRVAVMATTTLSVLVMLIVVFVFFSLMMGRIVLRRIDETNGVLAQITGGDLTAKVDIRDSREFASLSKGINTTVDALRGWIAEAETRMEAELNTAKAIQESVLPRTFPPFPNIRSFDIYASMHAAREVGGDFYDFFLIGEDSGSEGGQLGFVLADVSGKGVPAALFMMTAKTLLRDYMRAGLELGEAVENANRQLCDGNDAGMFVTVFAGILDYPSGHVTYVNAGHNPPLLWQNGAWHWLKEISGLPLGLFDGFPYEPFEIDCTIGDEFFIYTDGVTEAMNVDGELYGESRLEALINEHFDMHPRKLINAVREDVAAHACGAEQSDDITMLSLEVGVPPEVTTTLVVPATLAELPNVTEFIRAELERRLCPVKAQKQLEVAVEEMFVNVANYSYPNATPDNPGTARICFTYSADPPSVTIDIVDDGIPFDPLAKPDAVTPDDIMDVPIGGLGILMAKKSVDEMSYERVGNSNVVTLKKRW